MEREKLESFFCMKISEELNAFQKQMLQKSRREIYAHAYEIDIMINLYKFLCMEAVKLEEEALEVLLVFPGLLFFLYDRWLEYEDTYAEELYACLKQELSEVIQGKKKDKEGKTV